MAEEKIGWQLKNPCKYCLVKPACGGICKLLKKHMEVFTMVSSASIIGIYLLLLIALCIYSYTHWFKTFTWIGIVIFYLVHYGFVLYHHWTDPNELNRMEKWERWIILGVFPYAFLPVGLWSIFEHYVLDKYGYLYRYHKSINPYINTKEDF